MAALKTSIKAIFGSWLNTDPSNNLGLTTFIFFIVFSVLLAIMIRKAQSNEAMPKLRRVAGLDAIDEAIGRATEMGKPVLYNLGMNSFSAPTFASLAVLGYVAKRIVRYDTRIITVMRYAVVLPVAEEVVRQAYIEGGKPDMFRQDDVRFLSEEQFAYATGTVGIIQRDLVAANIMVGNFLAESLIFAEAGTQIGAIQIAATSNNVQTPFFIAACDYTLLAEELYVASAYLSQDRVKTATLLVQDYIKRGLVIIIILGILFSSFGSRLINDLLTLY
ncbi:MAG: hypothetical protein LLG09_04180 [Negativicutes bacterium]|nr:hypothetical protein [Negativicutes bacterium]